MRSRLFAVTFTLLSLFSCGPRQSPPPGYDGPIPSYAARELLGELQGRPLGEVGESFGGGSWTLDVFAVVPNPRTGKSPVMIIRSGERVDWIPLLTDGDIADLYERVLGVPPHDIDGETSDAYRTSWL